MIFVLRASRTLWFQIVLWLETDVVAFLGAIMSFAAASELTVLRALTAIAFQEIPLFPATLGALGGAIVLNVPLSLPSRSDASHVAGGLDAEEIEEDSYLGSDNV